jgi:hypothetical protein
VKIDELKKAKDQRPFRPFAIRMADGREILIGHPDAIAWDNGQPRIAVCVLPGARWEVIEVALVTSLGMEAPPAESSPAVPSAEGNGG